MKKRMILINIIYKMKSKNRQMKKKNLYKITTSRKRMCLQRMKSHTNLDLSILRYLTIKSPMKKN